MSISSDIKIEKVVLSCGGTGENLEKSMRLLKLLSGMKPVKKVSRRRIPSLGVRPGLEVGCMVTIRGKKINETLKKLLAGVDNRVKEKQIQDNFFSFGIKEYIEIPEIEYQRDIGIIGLDVTVVFTRAGKRVMRKKIKGGKIPKKQHVKKEEIVEFMKKKFNLEIE